MQQQDIVWVNIPFSDFQESKIRPALIISNNDYNSKNQDVVICGITSNIGKRPYSVFISENNLSAGRLPIHSIIRADKILQIKKIKIIKVFAKLNNPTFEKVADELAKLVSKKNLD